MSKNCRRSLSARGRGIGENETAGEKELYLLSLCPVHRELEK
jgi:hypothetical protein